MKKYIALIISLFILISCGSKKVTPEIFLIPSGYRGQVKVIFNEPCGQKEAYEGKKRLYIIPESGVLITQFKQELGIINQEFYYVDAKGNRTPIPEMEMADFNQDDSTKHFPNEPPRDKLGMFFGFTGGSESTGEKKYEFYGIYVGSFTEVMYSWMGNYSYEHAHDSLEFLQVKNCRSKK